MLEEPRPIAMRVASLIVVLGLSSASPAYALLVFVDLLETCDGLITRDTDSGLDWLDVTATTNRCFDPDSCFIPMGLSFVEGISVAVDIGAGCAYQIMLRIDFVSFFDALEN